jgi:hypothetical protein
VSDLLAPVCSITTTKRRRFFWAVWSSGAPVRSPFRKPDASGGGAETFEQALAEATRAAGMSVVVIEPQWARAWGRVLRGQAPWQGAASYPGVAPGERAKRTPKNEPENESIWTVLGVGADATAEELKLAFRRKALETHPDQGGDSESFRRVVRAFQEAKRRIRRPKKSRPSS